MLLHLKGQRGLWILKPLLNNFSESVLCLLGVAFYQSLSGNFAIEDLLPMVIHWQLPFFPSMCTFMSQFSCSTLQFLMLHFSESRSAVTIAMQKAAT